MPKTKSLLHESYCIRKKDGDEKHRDSSCIICLENFSHYQQLIDHLGNKCLTKYLDKYFPPVNMVNDVKPKAKSGPTPKITPLKKLPLRKSIRIKTEPLEQPNDIGQNVVEQEEESWKENKLDWTNRHLIDFWDSDPEEDNIEVIELE